jgi:ABC-type molybdate transport system substrate-binding protein
MTRSFPLVAVGSLAVVAALLLLLYEPPTSDEEQELLILCAAGIRPAVEATIADYQQEFPNVEVRVQPSGSGPLLANVLAGQEADLFLAADSSYLDAAYAQGKVAERLKLAVLTPVIAVRKGNPHKIESLKSLLVPGLRIGLGNSDGPAIGKASKQILELAGIWREVEKAARVFKPTVNDLATDLSIGTIDVAILYDAVVPQYKDLEAIDIPMTVNRTQDVSIGVLAASKLPTRALHFARYLAAREKGLRHFAANHYQPIDGDAWADRPDLRLMCGGMLRPVVEQTVREFERREGVSVSRSFNGCGILVANIKAGDKPDAYFACDLSFLTQVKDVFYDGVPVSRTRMVIAVPKGNPAKIRTLADLGRPGVKVGVANAKQSALGALTEALLRRVGLFDSVMANVQVQQPTADLLVAHLQGPHAAGKHLDAVISYEVNARRVPLDVDVIEIAEAHEPAVQPFAIGRESAYPHLAGRLLDAIRRAESKRRFEEGGFEWLAGMHAKGAAERTP